MQVRTKMRYLTHSLEWIIFKNDNTKCLQKIEQQTLLFTAGTNVKC